MIYTVLDVDDVQRFVGHVCYFGNCVADIVECTNLGILVAANTVVTDPRPYTKYSMEGYTNYSLIEPRQEWDEFLEKVKDFTIFDKKIAAEYLHYLAMMESKEEENESECKDL